MAGAESGVCEIQNPPSRRLAPSRWFLSRSPPIAAAAARDIPTPPSSACLKPPRSIRLSLNLNVQYQLLLSMPPMKHDVFICYRLPIRLTPVKFLFAHFLLSNVHDLPHAELLYNQLQDRGLSVFFDAKCLRFGEPWEPQITAALFSSAVIVLLISQAAVEGTICHDLLYFDQNCIQISLVCSSNEGSSADATSARLPPP